MVASCIAPALSTNMTQTFNSKTLKSSPEQMSTSTDSSTAKNFQKPTSKELLKILVPLIKCESTDIINCVIDSLGHFNPASLRDLMEEMAPILREANEKKQENVRRRKRKDCLRLYLVKILEYLAEGATFDFSEENSNQIATIVDWLYNLKGYIQPNNEPIPAGSTGSSSDAAVYTLQETRLHFCLLIHNVIIHTPKHKRKNLFTEDFKKTFFAIITNWTGSFELVLQKLQKRSPAHPLLDYRPETEPDDLCFVSLMTMCSLVCCGPVFDQQAITEDGYIVPWIVNIVDSNIEKLTGLCEDTLALMLTFNGDTHTLLDVLIDYCYTGSNHVSKIVFLAIVRVFTEHPDYPCDYISMITLSIVFTSNINTQLRENALQLFQLLYHRFLTEPNMSYVDKNSKCKSSGPESVGADQVGTPLEFVGSRLRSDQIIYMTQEEISRELAETLPDLTLSMFSEMTQRTETAKNHTQTNLLSCMVPWIYNIELVDFLYCSAPNGGSNCSSPHNTSGYNNVSNRNSSHTHYFRVKQQRSSSPVNNNRLILVGSGWGSRQATELVLNNLFYLTVKFGQELYKDLEFMWSCLVKHRAENIPVIIHYLVLITSVAPNYLLPFAKQIVVFLCKEKPKKLIENLFYSLQTIDGLNCCVERTTCMPFFRIMGNGAGGVSNNFTEYQPQSRGKCGSMLSSSSMSSNVVAVDHQHHQHQQHHQQSMTSSNHHHHHTMDNKRLLNNSQQLPAARSLTLDGGLSAGTKAAGVATVRQRAEPVPPSGCGVFSAPGTLRLDCDNEVTSLNADDDKYATLRAKDIRKSSNRALVAALIPEKQQQQRSRPQVHPLPLPAYGGYCAPLLVGFPITEPCPSWTQNYKSGVVLMLFLDIVTNKSARLYWERDLELLLHCIVLGLDHKEMLVHDQCKLLLVRVLQILCSDREEWQIMSQLMTGSSLAEHAAHSPGLIQADPHHFKTPIRLENHEAEKSWRQHFQRFTPTPAPVLSVATEESLTNTDNDMRSQIARVDGSQYDGSGGSTAIPVSTSRNLQRTVSSYSVTSTDTLIPPSQARSQAVAQTPQIKAPLVVVKDAPPRPPPVVRATPVISIVSAPVSTANQTIDDNEEEEHNTQSNATMQLIELLCACRGRPVWLYEDVSPARYISVGVNQAAVQQQQQSGSNSELILLSSGASLQLLVTLVCGLIDPDNTLAIKWAQLALNTGVNCTHRHYASRSLQVFRALSVPFDGIKLSALFSRLLDTIGDPNDDVQCYVVELLLTIESAIRDIVPLTNSAGAASSDSDRRPVSLASSLLHHVFGGSLSASASAGMTVRSEQMNSGDSDVEETAQRLERQAVNTAEEDNNEEGDDELHRSTPNLKNSFPSPRTDNNSRQRGSSAFGDSCNKSSAYKRSSAILEVSGLKKATRMSPVLGKYHFNKRAVGQLTGDGVLGLLTNSSTERSALSRDERTDLICELFWLANILLESDMEHEYFAGTRCLQRLAPLCLLLLQSPVSGGGSQARSEDSELRQKLEKMVPRLQWGPHGFPGTLHLIIKGCLIKNLWPVTTSLLSELIGGVHSRLADPTQRLGFPFAVLTLLATVFEEDSPGSRSAAAHIAAAASIYGGTTACPLTSAAQANLAKVMHLYASGSFTKDRSQWSRCVVKYLLDGYADSSAVADLLGFMTRLLEEGPIQSRALVLQALGHMVQCLPSGAAEPGVCAALASLTELLTSRAYMTSGALWREASGILRLVVARSSSLALPSSRSLHNAAVLLSMPLVPLPEAEPPKLELPGRVLDYQFDVRQHTRSMHDDTELASGSGIVDDGSTASRRTKTKELLLQLINAFGTYGYSLGFPKSPSVIFSQSTETLEHQISLHSSSETASTNDISLAGDLRLDETSSIEQAQVIRDLDEYLDSQLKMNFLDLPDEKWEDEKKPAWGVRSQSITQYQELPSTGQENTLGFTSVVGTFSTSGTGQLRDSPGQRRQVVVSHSPAKTVPTRAPKSPMSKALGGPNYCISSPQMQRPDSGAGTSTSQLQSSIRPQSLMFTGGSPTGPSQDGTAMMTSLSPSSKQKAPLLSSSSVDQPQHSSTTPASKKIIISKAGKSATSPETSSRQQLQKRHHRSASSEDELEVDEEVDEEDEDDIDMWQTREREVWIQRPLLNAGGSMRGATTSSECEDDDADEEFHGLGEIGGGAGHTEWGFQRRLRNLSLERSSSNNYEKEIEFVWCDTLAKALGSSHSTATLAIPATAASEESAAESPTLPLPSSPNHSSGSNSGGGLANLWTKFPQLFEDCCSKCSVCINEANYYVSVVPELSSIGAQFVNIVKQIGSKLNTPLFFVGGNHFIESGRLLESHKLTLMQMQETYDKFCNHVDYSFEILDLLKRSTRISHNNPEHVKPDEKRVSLCRQLHKMMTQLLLLYQSHCRFLLELRDSLLQRASGASASETVTDSSQQLQPVSLLLEQRLQDRQRHTATTSHRGKPIRSQAELVTVERQLYSALQAHDVELALSIWASNRVSILMFSKSLETDQPWHFLLQTYCRCLSRERPDLLVLLPSGADSAARSSPIQAANLLAVDLVVISGAIAAVERGLQHLSSGSDHLSTFGPHPRRPSQHPSLPSVGSEAAVTLLDSDSSVV